MQQRTYGYVGLISSSILFAMLLTILFVFTVSAHTVAPPGVQGVATPQLKNPHSYLKVDKQGFVFFSPAQAHMYDQVQNMYITDTTGQPIDLYLNGVFSFTIYPNQVYNAGLGGPGTYIFTIPNTNPNTMLTVIGK